ACSDTSANGSVSSATRMPISSGVADSSSAAVSGSARLVTCAPNAVIVDDAKMRRKSAERHRPRNRRRRNARSDFTRSSLAGSLAGLLASDVDIEVLPRVLEQHVLLVAAHPRAHQRVLVAVDVEVDRRVRLENF